MKKKISSQRLSSRFGVRFMYSQDMLSRLEFTFYSFCNVLNFMASFGDEAFNLKLCASLRVLQKKQVSLMIIKCNKNGRDVTHHLDLWIVLIFPSSPQGNEQTRVKSWPLIYHGAMYRPKKPTEFQSSKFLVVANV